MRLSIVTAITALALTACDQSAAPKSVASPDAEAAVTAPAAPVTPQEPAYVGAWAANASQCTLEQDDPDSPMLMAANGYDQHEAHCEFDSVTPAGDSQWEVTGRCATALTSVAALTFKVEGNTLTVSGDQGSHTYVRCP